jgi:hypothetical protein
MKNFKAMSDTDFISFVGSLTAQSYWDMDGILLEEDGEAYLARLLSVNHLLKPLCPDGNIKAGLCPSVLESNRIVGYSTEPFPTAIMVKNWSLNDLIDEYFGMCYANDREGTRLENGVKADILKRLPELASIAQVFSNSLFSEMSDYYAEMCSHEMALEFVAAFNMPMDLETEEDLLDWLVTQGVKVDNMDDGIKLFIRQGVLGEEKAE